LNDQDSWNDWFSFQDLQYLDLQNYNSNDQIGGPYQDPWNQSDPAPSEILQPNQGTNSAMGDSTSFRRNLTLNLDLEDLFRDEPSGEINQYARTSEIS
jgi:hypothetical protein